MTHLSFGEPEQHCDANGGGITGENQLLGDMSWVFALWKHCSSLGPQDH